MTLSDESAVRRVSDATRKPGQATNRTVAISPVLEAWVTKLEFRTSMRDGELYMSDPPTELRFRVAEQAGNFSLSTSWRGAAWRPVMHADRIYYLEAAMVHALFPGLRLDMNLPRLVIPRQWNMAAVGFVPQLLEDGGTTLLHNGSPMPFRMYGREIIGPVSRYSYFLGSSVPELIAAVESPDGGIVASRVAERESISERDNPPSRR